MSKHDDLSAEAEDVVAAMLLPSLPQALLTEGLKKESTHYNGCVVSAAHTHKPKAAVHPRLRILLSQIISEIRNYASFF